MELIAERLGSVDSVISAFYCDASFDVSDRESIANYKAIFLPGARLTTVGDEGAFSFDAIIYLTEVSGRVGCESTRRARELWRRTWQFGDVAHVTSAYRCFGPRGLPTGGGGLHSIQLIERESRWWITSVLRRTEYEGAKLPRAAHELAEVML